MSSFRDLYPTKESEAPQEREDTALVALDGGVRPNSVELREQYMTAEYAAEYLSVHRHTVYRMIKRGELPAAKVGWVYRIKKSDINALLEGKSQ